MRPGAPSVNPSGRAKPRTDAADTPREDGWVNALTGVGVASRDARQSTGYELEVVDRSLALKLWVGDDLAAKVIELEPEEMLRQGFKVNVQCDELPHERPRPEKPGAPKPGDAPEGDEDPEEESSADAVARTMPGLKRDALPPFGETGQDDLPDQEDDPPDGEDDGAIGVEAEGPPGIDEDEAKEIAEAVHELWEGIDLEGALYDALCYEGAYGGGAVLLGINDGQTLDMPVIPERVISIDYATALEPHEIVPQWFYTDPNAKKFGKVSHYQLNPVTPGSADPKAKTPAPTSTSPFIHESRIIAFPGIRVSRSQRVTSGYQGWGDGKFTRLWPVLRDFNQVWAAAAILMKDFSVAVMKIKNLAELVAHDKGRKFRDRMEAIALSQSFLKMKLVDAEGEDYERKTTSVTGLDLMMAKFSDRFCVAAGYPKGMIFERESGGLGDGAAAEIRTWYDRLKSKQKRKLGAPLKFLATCSFKAVQKTAPKRWYIGFNPLWQPTELETANLRKIYTDIDVALVTNQIATPEEVRVGRYGGGEFDTELKLNTSAEYMESMELERAAVEEEERQANLEAMKIKAESGAPAGPPGAEKADAFDPDQPRDEGGKWTSNGGGLGRTKDEGKRKARAEQVEKAVGETRMAHTKRVAERREKELDDAILKARQEGRNRGFEAAKKELGDDAPFEKITQREQEEAGKAAAEARQAKIQEFIAKNAEVQAEGKAEEDFAREELARRYHLEDALEEGRIKPDLPTAVKEYQTLVTKMSEDPALDVDVIDEAGVAAVSALNRTWALRGEYDYLIEMQPEELEGYGSELFDLPALVLEDVSADFSGAVETLENFTTGENSALQYSDRPGYAVVDKSPPEPPNYADDEGVWSEESVAKYRALIDAKATEYRKALDDEQTALEALHARLLPVSDAVDKYGDRLQASSEKAFNALEGEDDGKGAAELITLPKSHPEYEAHEELAGLYLQGKAEELGIYPDESKFNDEHLKDSIKAITQRVKKLAKITGRAPSIVIPERKVKKTKKKAAE